MGLHLSTYQCTEVRFASLLSSGFTAMAVINPLEKKMANRTSVQWTDLACFGGSFDHSIRRIISFTYHLD
jgi:hypothetical protein